MYLVWGGCAQVRATLYMASVVVIDGNPAITTTCYQRLCGVEKSKRMALIACMRKLPDHTQRDAQASDALADGTASARVTVKTVADTKPFALPGHLHVVEML